MAGRNESDDDLDSERNEDTETESELSDDDNTILPPVWSNNTIGPRRIPFLKENKLLVPVPGDNKPIDWFNLLVDDEFLQFICDESNKYALEFFCGPRTTERSRITKWKDITVPELRVFLGLLLHTGTIRLNRLQDYWKTNRFFNLPFFRSQMSRDRFLLILRCLHFSPPDQQSTVRTDKIQKVVDYFNSKMSSIYYPGKELSIDEAMILWRGRLVFRQYIKNKRHKYGVKLYCVNEPEGLTVKFKIYGGGGDELSGPGHTSKVVFYLMQEMLGNGHAIYMDNFYNSFSLASQLLANNTYCTGTLQAGRKMNPAAVVTKQLKKGESIVQYAEGVSIGKWKDKRVVMYITTEHETDLVSVSNKRGQERLKPLPIVQYNAHMKGVDRADQMMAYYPCERKTLRWYKKIFIHVLQMLLINSFHLYNMNNITINRTKKTLYDYRMEVLDSLLPPPIQQQQLPRTPTTHRLVKNDERDAKGGTKRKKCRMCYRDGKNKKSIFLCVGCPDRPGLCPVECFDKFHKN